MSDHTEVYNSRQTKAANQVWRRRRCLECEHTFTTYERPDLSFLQINGHPYVRARLYQSVLGSFKDQASQLRYLDDCIDTIEAKLLRQPTIHIEKATLIKVVLQTLRPISTAAFLQYMAQYQPLDSQLNLKTALKKYSH